jgi:hypothetical protein
MPAAFPTLRTTAIAQYPLDRASTFAGQANSFLDYSRQAYRDLVSAKKTWTIALNLLDAGEIAVLKAFFEQQQGRNGVFTFTDPVDASVHSTCSFADDTFTQHQSSETSNAATLTIYEHV